MGHPLMMRFCLSLSLRTAMEELTEAQQHQERVQGELESTRESLDMTHMDMQDSMSKVFDSRERHDVVCRDLQARGLPRRNGKRTMLTTV